MLLLSFQSLSCLSQTWILSGHPCSSSSSSSSAGLLSPWLYFLLIRMGHSWAWGMWYWKAWGDPSCLQDDFPWVPARRSFTRSKSAAQLSWTVILPFALFLSLRILDSISSRSQQPKLPSKLYIPQKIFFVCKYHIQQNTSSISISKSMTKSRPVTFHCSTPGVWAIPTHLCNPYYICPELLCGPLVPPCVSHSMCWCTGMSEKHWVMLIFQENTESFPLCCSLSTCSFVCIGLEWDSCPALLSLSSLAWEPGSLFLHLFVSCQLPHPITLMLKFLTRLASLLALLFLNTWYMQT